MRPLVQALLASVAGLTLSASSLAQITDLGLGPYDEAKGNSIKLKLPRSLELEAITLQELIGIGSASNDLGAWSETAIFAAIPQFPEPTIVRTVPNLWQLKIGRLNKGNGVEPGAVDVSYEVVGANGTRDRFSHVDHSSEEISVEIVPTEPFSFIRGNNQIIEAGASFHLQLGTARAAGLYRGALTVTVHYY